MKQLTEEQAREIYQVLVDVCGATEDECMISSFVYHQTKGVCTEWRFGGQLGFGGKFWRNSGRWYVNAYQEDYDKNRLALIDEANARLEILKERFGFEGYDV